jgi:hypothetical protein
VLYLVVLSHVVTQDRYPLLQEHALEHFFEEVDTGSSKENAINQELRAVDLIDSDRQPL